MNTQKITSVAYIQPQRHTHKHNVCQKSQIFDTHNTQPFRGVLCVSNEVLRFVGLKETSRKLRVGGFKKWISSTRKKLRVLFL